MIESEDDDVGAHALNVAGTQPVILPIAGIPFRDAIVYFVAASQCWLFRWQLLIPLGVFVAFMIVLYRRDPYAGRRLLCWLGTSALCLLGESHSGTFIRVEPGRHAFRGVIPCLFRS